MNPIKFKRLLPVLVLPVILWSGTLKAEVPRVVADIAPIHSLVSMVMDGVGEPQLLIPQNASPHHYSMRPSEAKALQEADLAVYVGHDMTPWLEPLFETVATSADVLDLSEVDEVLLLSYREGPVFDEHEGHEDHEEEGHDDHAGHDHDGTDPHMWLDPVNATLWLDAIASKFGRIDPQNANRYIANAESGKERIAQATHRIEDYLVPVHNQEFLVFHDAFQYFEKRFGIAAVGSISLGDASKPSSRRLRELKHLFEERGINCVLSEPQFSSDLIDNVFGDHKLRFGVVDPVGLDLKLGPSLYPEVLENIALGIAQCVKQ
ncbi:MAG: zinc ABC transporter substrate-binding protein [Arenicellales bacterium]